MGSYRQPFDYACAQCRHAGSHAVWLVVDVDERPDLATLIRTRQIRSHRSEACGSPVEINASLLTGRPGIRRLGPGVGAALLALGGRPTGDVARRELLEAARIEMTGQEERYVL